MKKLCSTLLMCVVCLLAFGKSDYYFYKGKAIPIKQNYNMLYLTSDNAFSLNGIANYVFETTHEGVEKNNSGETTYWKIVRISNDQLSEAAYLDLITLLNDNINPDYIGPVIGVEYPVAVSEYFYVELKNTAGYNALVEQAELYQCELIGQVNFMPGWYKLKSSKNAVGNALELANLMSETNLFANTDPGFMFDFKPSCITDPSFSQQWALNNTSNPNADINACDAWNITTGSKSVLVAVLDQGVDQAHGEFSTNSHPHAYDCRTHTSDNNVYGNHGTHVGGIIGANQNASQISGIAPDVEMMSVSHPLSLNPTISEELAEGISWAWENGASIINNSWGDQGGAFFNDLHSAILESSIMNAMNNGRNGLGTIVVFAAGNHSPVTDYPGNFTPEILLVGATTSSGVRSSFSGYGSVLDVVAPGSNILSTLPNNAIGNLSGTSMAAPYAAGVTSLILSVNNTLTRTQVMNTIEATCQKLSAYTYTTTGGRTNGIWNNQTGYGLIDAHAAVLSAQSQCTSGKDLYSRDWFNDYGFEPNTHTGVHTPFSNSWIYLSEDVWIRNQPDGMVNHEHQNPEYSSTNNPSQLNFIYVRVGNRGCTASNGTEQVRVHWAKASIGPMTWPDNWNGTKYLDPPTNNALAGDVIGTATIPVLQPGESVVVQLPVGWNPPNPDDYDGISNEEWHFCVVAQILDPSDPSAVSADIGKFTADNNNVIWKNFSVVNNIAGFVQNTPCKSLTENIAVAVSAHHQGDFPEMYNIAYDVPMEDLSGTITDEGDIIVKFDEELYQNWVAGGKQGHGFTEIAANPGLVETVLRNTVVYDLLFPSEEKLFKINGTSVSFDNIRLDPDKIYSSSVFALYPTSPVTNKTDFKLNVSQVNTLTGKTIGGVMYDFNKPVCSSGAVSAGNDQTIDRGCVATLAADKDITCAAYWWIDEFGNVVSEEKTAKVRVTNTTDYTLTVVSPDGCVSTDEVTVNVSNNLCALEEMPYCFTEVTVTPNPVSDGVLALSIKSNDPQSAQISINNLLTGDLVYRAVRWLEDDLTNLPIDVSNLGKGLYSVSVGCTDGQTNTYRFAISN